MRYTKRDGNYTGKERKLWELENDIEDGLLVRLPCKIGDAVYHIFDTNNTENQSIININIDKDGITFETEFYMEFLEDYNKTWFTDRELAEKKLEEIKLWN